MSLESTIRTVLMADAGVTTLVGARIYPMAMPQAPTLPAVVYQRISTIPGMVLDGGDDLGVGRIQLSTWALTFDGARALKDAVVAALQGKTVDANGVRLILLLNWNDDYEPDTKLFRCLADFRVISTQGVAA